MRLAAIDLGTVTSRLLIADVADGRLHELYRGMQITHLGEDLHKTGIIKKQAITREVQACRAFISTINAVGQQDGRPVEQVCAVATSAMRDARNSREVCEALQKAGLTVEVISGKREAELSFLGTISGFAAGSFNPHEPLMAIDVGGGSTEVTLGGLKSDGTGVQILFAHSFDMGSRRVTDAFLAADPPSIAELKQAKDWIRAQLQAPLGPLAGRAQALIAVAGTATTAATVKDEISEYDPWKIHGATITAEELNEVLHKLAALRLKDRKQLIGLEPNRASVIVGGLLVLQGALELLGMNAFIVSETDILQGMVLVTGQGLTVSGQGRPQS